MHIDISEYKVTDNIKVFIYMVVDNFSRKILGCRIDVIKSAQLAMENLRQVYERYNIALLPPVITVMSDDGSENHSVTGQFFEEKPNLVRIITGQENNHSNNMIEAVFRKVKQCFIYQKEYSSIADFTARTFTDIAAYNSEMPLDALDGSTPDEAFKFLNPYFSRLSGLMQITQRQRIEENRSGRCF